MAIQVHSRSMIACLDVDYRGDAGFAGCVLFRDWADEKPQSEAVVRVDAIEPYVPGQFYRRELPCLLAVLGSIAPQPEVVVIDGYVWLGEEDEPGLGAHLHRAIEGRSPVVGVAKTRFLRARRAREILRGSSLSPLFVTAAGMDPDEAAARVLEMHGPHRIPTLLRRVDGLCRGRDG